MVTDEARALFDLLLNSAYLWRRTHSRQVSAFGFVQMK